MVRGRIQCYCVGITLYRYENSTEYATQNKREGTLGSVFVSLLICSKNPYDVSKFLGDLSAWNSNEKKHPIVGGKAFHF